MSDLKNLRQAQDSIRRTRFMPLSRSERVALAAEAVGHILPYANSAWLYIRPDGKLEDCITYPHCYPDLQKVYASELHDSPTRMGLLPWRSLLQIAGVVDPGQITLGLCSRLLSR